MKKYKHKKTKIIAKEYQKGVIYLCDDFPYYLPSSMVEGCSDWEEIIETITYTTKDGVNIKEGDFCYWISFKNYNHLWERCNNPNIRLTKTNFDLYLKQGHGLNKYKIFSSKEAADEFLSKQNPVLFTTEDGVDIKQYEDYYYIQKHSFKIQYIHSAQSKSEEYKRTLETLIYFKSKEKAEEYILLNKSCLSYNDLKGIEIKSTSRETIKEIIKSKINK